MYLAICAGTPVALLQVGPLTFCCQYLAAYIVAFLGSLGRRQSPAMGSWILRGGASSSLAENYRFSPDDQIHDVDVDICSGTCAWWGI